MGKSNYDKLMTDVVRLAEANGWRVSRTRKGHFKFMSPDKSQPIIHLSGTPSDTKTYICSMAQLRRHGLPVPH